ncbi:MAG: DUF58 domain-containing protein [Puniceicoccaceae bacterium]|nr:MAG: DUF58 domain-containing protein [Puniceicoccaceae bacterium]
MATNLIELLSPATLARIDNLALMAKVAVDGFISGLHRSLAHGTGSEFLQYRNYAPGDDLKYVDWKLYSRRDRFYTKVFREETNMHCVLVVDASGSMDYRGTRAPCSKFHYTTMIAACLAYLATRQGDSVGLCLYADRLLEVIPPRQRQGQLPRILHALARHQPRGPADHGVAWRYLSGHLRRPGMVVFLSDFLEAEEAIPPILSSLHYAKHEVIAAQILDRDETDFPFDDAAEFVAAEGEHRILTYPPEVRRHYTEKMNAWLGALSEELVRAHADQLLFLTDESLALSLSAYLNKRDAMR